MWKCEICEWKAQVRFAGWAWCAERTQRVLLHGRGLVSDSQCCQFVTANWRAYRIGKVRWQSALFSLLLCLCDRAPHLTKLQFKWRNEQRQMVQLVSSFLAGTISDIGHCLLDHNWTECGKWFGEISSSKVAWHSCPSPLWVPLGQIRCWDQKTWSKLDGWWSHSYHFYWSKVVELIAYLALWCEPSCTHSFTNYQNFVNLQLNLVSELCCLLNC